MRGTEKAMSECVDIEIVHTEEVVQHLVVLAANFSIRIVPEQGGLASRGFEVSALIAPRLDMPAHTASWIFGEPSAVSNCTHARPVAPGRMGVSYESYGIPGPAN